MLDLKFIREHPEQVKKGAAEKKRPIDVDQIVRLDQQRRDFQTMLDQLLFQKNALSGTIHEFQQKQIDPQPLIQKSRNFSIQIKQLKKKISETEQQLETLLLTVPNLPLPEVTHGAEKPVIREYGKAIENDFELLPYWSLAEKLGLINYTAAGRLVGSFFSGLVGAGARLERALGNFMLDMHGREHGYIEISPPLLSNRETLIGTGQIPKMENEMYHLPRDDFFLIPTAEVPLTAWHQDEILEEASLPRKYTAGTPCFRREAGTHGRENRGLIRVHQFEKIELVQLCTPAQAEAAFAELLSHAERVLQLLKLPYRVVRQAASLLSFASEKTYDLEVWAPGVEKWLEISSVSNFGDFQARRANIRYRPAKGDKPRFVHTLNGSGLALARLVAVLWETGQTPTGRVLVPEALRPYMGGQEYLDRQEV